MIKFDWCNLSNEINETNLKVYGDLLFMNSTYNLVDRIKLNGKGWSILIMNEMGVNRG